MENGPHRLRGESNGRCDALVLSRDIRRSRTPSPHTRIANKREDKSAPATKLSRSSMDPAWLLPTERTCVQMEMHQSTCLNLNNASTDNTDADFWILPDFDDWELDAETHRKEATQGESHIAPLLQRAATSNRERLKARLEGDGWDFVGGKYGQGEKVASQSEDSVDEEFDVVVLPDGRVSS
jgi:hypothetical protein